LDYILLARYLEVMMSIGNCVYMISNDLSYVRNQGGMGIEYIVCNVKDLSSLIYLGEMR